jgi:hypothetical protein
MMLLHETALDVANLRVPDGAVYVLVAGSASSMLFDDCRGFAERAS